MAFNLASIRRGKEIKPPRILLYGPHGLGKSTFPAGDAALGLAGAPKPIFIPTEDGLATIDVPSFPLCKTFADVMSALETLYTSEHDFQTVVLDSTDWMEKLVWQETCRIHSKADIEEFGYGKGYGHATDVWKGVLDGFQALRDQKNMVVLFTAHCQVRRFDSPETEPYDRYMPKLHTSASALIQEWADAVFFTNYKTVVKQEDVGFNQKVARGITTGQRVMYTTEKPAYLAKNRYRLPDELPLDWTAFTNAVAVSAAPVSTVK